MVNKIFLAAIVAFALQSCNKEAIKNNNIPQNTPSTKNSANIYNYIRVDNSQVHRHVSDEKNGICETPASNCLDDYTIIATKKNELINVALLGPSGVGNYFSNSDNSDLFSGILSQADFNKLASGNYGMIINENEDNNRILILVGPGTTLSQENYEFAIPANIVN